MIAFAHSRGLEVLLETHTEENSVRQLKPDADLIGINNRNLGTLKIDLNTTKEILKRNSTCGKIVVSESGIKTPRRPAVSCANAAQRLSLLVQA